MSKSRLPETDLARIAPLPEIDQWRLLRKMRSGFSQITYKPARRFSLDAFDIQTALPMVVESPSKEKLLAAVRAASKPGDEAEANVEVVGLIYDFVRKEGITGIAEEFAPLKLAPGYSASYWTNAILRWRERLLVVNKDFRRSTGYSPEGRRFAISVAHQRIRMMGGDLSEVELGILNFPTHRKRPRSIKLIVPKVELFTFDQLAEMTARTLAIWDAICNEKALEERAKAANDDGPLFTFGRTGEGS